LGLRIRILGADSIGSRSMATVVEADGLKILIDPGVSYAPRRYGLPPHPLELKRLEEIKQRILDEIADADYVVITHYHYDHYLREPEEADYYRGKVLLVKHPTRNINFSQKMRAHRLLRRNRVGELASRVAYLDGGVFELDRGIRIRASPPVPHGAEGTKLGYVVMVAVECCGEVFVHASDVQGPISSRAYEWITSARPTALFISGPPTYFAGFKVPREEVETGLANLARLAASLPGSTIISAKPDHQISWGVFWVGVF
jgi:predicted metallo-beta-lactamase superfamily hydrolase